MNERRRRVYVVHDERGRILGLAPVVSEQTNERVRLGYRPVPEPHQKMSEVELSEEHSALAPHELLGLEIVVDPQTGRPQLRRPQRATPKQ
jgi:hypothetical protein